MLTQPPSALRSLFVATALFLSLAAQAQTPALSIYFASAADTLDARARAQIDSLSQAAKNWGAYSLEIQAFTDDIGSSERNTQLSASRAQNVSSYLLAQAPQPSQKRLQLKGEIQPKAGSNLAQERARARRVDLIVLRENPQTLQEFFELSSQQAKQYFSLPDANKPAKFAGKKGTVLSIPAQAFERADGKKIAPVLPISIELREAYTAGEMISQNLSTTSGGKLLQTGGSIYTEARDANGNLLRLRSGKSIDLSMPQKDKDLPSDMQVFTAQRTGTQNAQTIDWQATNRPFSPERRSNAERATTTPSVFPINSKGEHLTLSFPYTAHSRDGYYTTIENIYPKTVVEYPQAPLIVEPTKPIYLNPSHPNKETLFKENTRLKGEKKRKYKARIDALYAAAYADYQQQKQADEIAKKDYLAKKQQNAQTLRNYQAAQLRYNNYADSLYQTAYNIHRFFYGSTLYLREDKRSYDVYSNAYATCLMLLDMRKNVQNFAQVLPIDILGDDSSRTEFAEMYAAQIRINADIADLRLRCQQAQFPLSDTLLRQINDKFSKTLAHNAALDTLREDLNLSDYYGSGKKPLLDTLLPKKHAIITQKIEPFLANHFQHFRNNQDINRLEELVNICADAGYRGIYIDNASIYWLFGNLQKAYKKKKLQLGELSDDESLRLLASSTQMGWINCDRFLNIPAEDCMHFTLQYPTDENTQFFVVLPDNKSIIALQAENENTYTCRQYNGLPKTEKAKLVGLRVVNGKFALSIQESTVQQLHLRAQPTFRECSSEQALRTFATL